MAKTTIDLKGNRIVADEFVGDIKAGNAAIAALTLITTPDATDEATAVTLANATKAKVNAIIAALQG